MILEEKFKGLRCVHRQSFKNHPSCFLKGKIKPNSKLQNTWYNQNEVHIGFVDIESDGLKVDFSTMLTWCVKERGGEVSYDVITKDDLFSGVYDKRIVASLIKKLQEFDIIVGYYSKRFDIPFVRAKTLHYGLDFPMYDELYHWDLYDSVKSKLGCLSRRSLDAACDYLGIKGKTNIDKEIWRVAKYGDRIALKEVLQHNIADTIITEQLFNKLEFSRKWIKSTV